MKVEVEELSKVERRVHIEVPWDTVQHELNEAYKALGRKAQLKGFRAGRVPRKVLEQYYRKTVEGEVVNRLVDDSFRQAIQDNDLFPIDRPTLDEFPEITAKEPLKFVAKVEVKPEVEVGTFKGLVVEKTVRPVADEEVDKELQALLEKAAVVEPVTDRDQAETGDIAVVDFFGYVDGESFKGGKGINYSVELGTNQMIPGFEEQLTGMRVGEHKTFELGFPEGVGPEEAAGKTVEWQVDLKEIKRKIYPDLDDEFAQDLGEYDTLEELKANVRENLATREDARSKRELRDRVSESLVEANPIEVPPAMVERQLASMMEDAERLLQQNPDPKLVEAVEKLRTDLRPQAEKRVAALLLLEAVARMEDVQVSEEELNGRIQELARENRMTAKQVKQQLRSNDQLDALRYSLVQDKTLDLILENAEIQEKPAEEADEAVEE